VADVEISDVTRLEPFEFHWPKGTEAFEGGWAYNAEIGGTSHIVRHWLGARLAYGRLRVHTVTWVDAEILAYGIEADDYPVSQALLSRVRHSGRAIARTLDQVPAEYGPFEIVEHRRELDAPYSPSCLAIKLREDDLPGWALVGWLRDQLARRPAGHADAAFLRNIRLQPPRAPDAQAAGRALLAHAGSLAVQLSGRTGQFSPDSDANALVREDGFAFLLGVIANVGVRSGQAWALPFELRKRLGGLSPSLLSQDPAAVREAVQQHPELHRFGSLVPDLFVQAADIILQRYGGSTVRLWSDQPTAMQLCRRLEKFPGIDQKKAGMAAEVIAGVLRKPLRQLSGTDVAGDAHLRRVFLRTGMVRRDESGHMAEVVRAMYPDRPGALGIPAWDVGRRWCRPADPDCPACPLNVACARLIRGGA
jgi:hypothetical protein